MRRGYWRLGQRLEAAARLEPQFDASGCLVRLGHGAELAVVIQIEAHRIAEAERSRPAGIHAISAFADALHRDALRAEADGDRAEILHDVVDQLAVGGKIENLAVEDPVVPD